MKPPVPMPDVGELRDSIDQWAEFVGDLEAKDYTFDIDNWRNDVDARQIVQDALPMFSREEIGDHALKLDRADAAFKAATRDLKKCVWGHGTQRKEKWTPQQNWWYFRTPVRSNEQLEDELANVR
ncbi:MAG: hypothetical protein JSR24_02290 [Proteobacteria bacterium]|nr:hypothetical protein [Pseudomonadota bacterium]